MRKARLLKGHPYSFDWNDVYAQHGWFDDDGVRKETIKGPQQSAVGFFVQEVGDWYVIARQKNEYLSFPPWGDLCWLPKGSVKKIISLD